MKDILLLAVNARFVHPAYGLFCLKANLHTFDLEERAEILEYTLSSSLDALVDELLERRPKILAFSVYIWNHTRLLEIVDSLLKAFPINELPLLVFGGPELEGFRKTAHAWDSQTVYLYGEGEALFARLCNHYLLDTGGSRACLESFPEASIEDQALVLRGGAPLDLEALRLAYYMYSDEDLRLGRFVYVESSRGCPYNCAFCASSLEKTVRFFPLEAFLDAMAELIRRGAKKFKFLDRSFNADIPRAVKIARFFRDHLPADGFVQFEMVPERFPEALQEVLSSFPEGMLRLEIGIQTLNPQTARLISRPLKEELLLKNLRWLKEHTKAIIHADLIAGLPGEDLESFATGFDQIWSLKPGELQLGLLKRLPGTALCLLDTAYGMEYDEEPPYQVQKTTKLSREALADLEHMARLWEHVVNRDHFEKEVESFLPPGKGAFEVFAAFSRFVVKRFGRSYGIDRQDMRQALEDWRVFGEGVLSELSTFYYKLDLATKPLWKAHRAFVQCRKGCSFCCTGVDFSPLEQAYLAKGLEEALKENPGSEYEEYAQRVKLLDTGFSGVLDPENTDEAKEGSYRCVFLGGKKHTECKVYAWRPLICRVHGLPLAYPVEEYDEEGRLIEAGEAQEFLIRFCDKNYYRQKTEAESGALGFLNMQELQEHLERLNQRYKQR